VAQLCQTQQEFEALGTRVLIISFGTLPAAQTWLKETCATFDFLLDPERTVYQAYGLERSLFRSWSLRTIWTYIKLLLSGRKWRGIQGDSSQLGGDFLIDRHGSLLLAFRSHDPVDRPSADKLLALIRRDLSGDTT
jgi:hypothetical protein